MSDTKTMSTSARFAQIVSILRKHHLQKGMDPVKFRMILEDLGPTRIDEASLSCNAYAFFDG